MILSLVSAFKAKTDPAICRGFVVERLLRLFEFKTWREMYIILLDFSCFCVWYVIYVDFESAINFL